MIPNDLDSKLQNILDFESDHCTDVLSDSDDEPIRTSMLSRRRRRRINSSESLNDGQPLYNEDVGLTEQQLTGQLIMPITDYFRVKMVTNSALNLQKLAPPRRSLEISFILIKDPKMRRKRQILH